MTAYKPYTLSPSKPKKEPSWFLIVLLSGILSGVLLFALGWYLYLPDMQKSTVLNRIPGIAALNRPKLLLIMGVDMPPHGFKNDYKMVRTDTMMLVKLDTANKKVHIVSIPRDSKVYIAGGPQVDKINAAFTFNGPEGAVSTVENTLGVKIDNYAVMNLRGVRDVVDALGGIDIYVEKPMRYRDRTAKLNINLQPGKQHLNGVQAEGYLRFRHDALGDIGRIRRQQQFIAAISAKLKDPGVLFKVKPLIDASSKFVLTDMPPQEMLQLAMFAKDLDRSNYEVATLPGHPSSSSRVSYWIIDPQSAEAVLNRLIMGVQEETSEEPGAESEKPTVGILYTTDRSSALASYKAALEDKGFHVVCQSRIRGSGTKLITHSSHVSQAMEKKLQQTDPSLSSAQLIFSPHGGTFESNACGHSDFTVILGNDTRS